METRRAVLEEATARLERVGIDNARRNAEWLLGDVLGCRRAELYAYPERVVATDRLEQFWEMVARRGRHEPLQYILEYEEFYGLRLRVSPSVLIPRPETEEVVEEALRCIQGLDTPHVLDVGTGSGCIALALQHERSDASVYACDVSRDALTVARSNAEVLGLPVQFFEADVSVDAIVDHVPAPIDLVVSNPPYIPVCEAPSLSADVREHEPALALFAGNDPLHFYRVIGQQAQTVLTDNGRLVLETHAHYAEDVQTLLQATGFTSVRIAEDLSNRPRMVIASYRTGD